ncbi:MAG: formylmethanofuran dehydrogenase subunit C [Pseudomonadota bacterium]
MALTLTPKTDINQRLDLSAVTPSQLASMASTEITKLDIGCGLHPVTLGDVFTVAGDVSDGTVIIAGGSARFDNIATKLDGGSVHVVGDVGDYAGADMTGGELTIDGSARHHLGSSMLDGRITVKGDVADRLGAPRPGVRDGIAGGIVIVNGTAGDDCSERQRRGLVLIKGQVGKYAGGRMLGGTLWSLTGFGEGLGVQMRRGTILTPQLENPLSTFLDCGQHTLGILTIMARHYAALLGADAPPIPTGAVRRYAGDMASIGRGEILVTG